MTASLHSMAPCQANTPVAINEDATFITRVITMARSSVYPKKKTQAAISIVTYPPLKNPPYTPSSSVIP
jgi:hypothetical protein